MLCASRNAPRPKWHGNKTSFKKGIVVWNKGIKGKASHSFGNKYAIGITPSAETRAKISAAQMGHKSYTEGMKFSPETKQKMSATARKRVSDGLHHLGNGSKTKLSAQIRKSFKYRQWRSDVFTKDDFSCQECSVRGGVLNADHIEPFAFILRKYNIANIEGALNCEELWNINNGRTLCVPCHKNTESYLNRWLSPSLSLPQTKLVDAGNGGILSEPTT
jgi:hypothetical protein